MANSQDETATVRWAPVFVQGDNEFVIPAHLYTANTEEGARDIGGGCMLVECVILRIEYARRAVRIDGDFPHIEGVLPNPGGIPVRIAAFAGPLFDSSISATTGEATSDKSDPAAPFPTQTRSERS